MSAYSSYMRGTITLCIASSLLNLKSILSMDSHINNEDASAERLQVDPWLHYPPPIHDIIAIGTQLRPCQLIFEKKRCINVPPHLIHYSRALWNNAQILPDDAQGINLRVAMTSQRNQDLIAPLLQLCASAQWQENLRLEAFHEEISESICLLHKLHARILARCPITAHFRKLSRLPEKFWHEINVAANFEMTLILTRLAHIISHIYRPYEQQSLTPNLDKKIRCFKHVLSEPVVCQKATQKTQRILLHYLGPCPCAYKRLKEQLFGTSLEDEQLNFSTSKLHTLISDNPHADDPEPLVTYIRHKKGAQ